MDTASVRPSCFCVSLTKLRTFCIFTMMIFFQQSRSRVAATSLAHLQDLEETFGVQGSIPLGFWLDGIPFAKQREESLECDTLNIPGLLCLRLQIGLLPPMPLLMMPWAFWSGAWCSWRWGHSLVSILKEEGSGWRRRLSHKSLGVTTETTNQNLAFLRRTQWFQACLLKPCFLSCHLQVAQTWLTV